MTYDAGLAARLEALLPGRPRYEGKKMFGGIGWLLNGNMCVGVYKEWLIARVGTDAAKKVLASPHAKPMDITGMPMKGWVMIALKGIDKDHDLEKYFQLAERFVKTLPRE